MARIAALAAVIVLGLLGNYLYRHSVAGDQSGTGSARHATQQFTEPFNELFSEPAREPVSEPIANPDPNQVVVTRCVTSDGSTHYGNVPLGVECSSSETINFSIKSSIKSSPPAQVAEKFVAPASRPPPPRCDGRKLCAQMTSCAEARFFLRNCPDTMMDGDDDGIPCESQWCG